MICAESRPTRSDFIRWSCSYSFLSILQGCLQCKSRSCPAKVYIALCSSHRYRTSSLPVSKVLVVPCACLLVLQPHWLAQEVRDLKHRAREKRPDKKQKKSKTTVSFVTASQGWASEGPDYITGWVYVNHHRNRGPILYLPSGHN